MFAPFSHTLDNLISFCFDKTIQQWIKTMRSVKVITRSAPHFASKATWMSPSCHSTSPCKYGSMQTPKMPARFHLVRRIWTESERRDDDDHHYDHGRRTFLPFARAFRVRCLSVESWLFSNTDVTDELRLEVPFTTWSLEVVVRALIEQRIEADFCQCKVLWMCLGTYVWGKQPKKCIQTSISANRIK